MAAAFEVFLTAARREKQDDGWGGRGIAQSSSAKEKPSPLGIVASINASRNGRPWDAARSHSKGASWPSPSVLGVRPHSVRISDRMQREEVLSSTTRMGNPVQSLGGDNAGEGTVLAWASKPAVKWNVLPSPGTLSTPISPPIIAMSRSEIARPSPVPPKFRVVEPSACTNGWKIARCFSRGMPMPVSRTENRSTIRPSWPAPDSTFSTTSPDAVNLIALPIRLMSTWRSRPGSPTRWSGTSWRDPAARARDPCRWRAAPAA